MTKTRNQKMLRALQAAATCSTLTSGERELAEIKYKLTKTLNHLLYTEWDPIGVHLLRHFHCTAEYQLYLPGIVDMVLQGASFAELSDRLMELEGYMLGDDHIRRRCDVIAVMASHFGPHTRQNPFVASVNTDTRAAAYQSVLDLVTQTRLDAYQGKWNHVRVGYLQAVELCQSHLADKHQLLGACLNNLGQAYSALGELGNALKLYQQALPELGQLPTADHYSGVTCLKNIINNLEHRRQFAAAMAYHDQMARAYLVQHGQHVAHTAKRPAPRLCPRRISVERDGCGMIQQYFAVS
jgi:tetratricopeptide (TPR) repeat protein